MFSTLISKEVGLKAGYANAAGKARQNGEAKAGITIHQTWGLPFSRALYLKFVNFTNKSSDSYCKFRHRIMVQMRRCMRGHSHIMLPKFELFDPLVTTRVPPLQRLIFVSTSDLPMSCEWADIGGG